MFKKFKRTKIVLGASALTAMVAFPIASLVSNDQETWNNVKFDASTTIAAPTTSVPKQTPINVDFKTSGDGKRVQTPENVITTEQLSPTLFKDSASVNNLLVDTPKILDQYTKNAQANYIKDSAGALAAAGKVALAGTGVYSIPDVTAFGNSGPSLYKDLNPGMSQSGGAGTRYDFMVPNKIVSVTGLDSTKKFLEDDAYFKNTPSTNPFVYKIATIDPTKIAEKQQLVLDYMYQDPSNVLRKFQIIMPHSQELFDNDDTVTLSELLENRDIFFRTTDSSKRITDSEIKSKIALSNSGLTMVKDDSGISLYTTLNNKDAKSAIMIDSDSKEASASATVGIIEASTQNGGVIMSPINKDVSNKVTSFDEFSIAKDWVDSPHDWTNGGGSSATQKLTMYVKKGTTLNNVELKYINGKNTITKSISIKAGDTAVSVEPAKTTIEVSEGNISGDRTFDLGYAKEGDWYKVDFFVDKNATNPFFVGDNNSQEENPWILTAQQKNAPVFFEDPTIHKTWKQDSFADTVTLDKEVNDDSVEKTVYKDVYGSWVSETSPLVTYESHQAPGIIKTLREDAENPVNSAKNDIWKDFKYYLPKEHSLDISEENSIPTSLDAADTMEEIIKKLNAYHNKMVGILVDDNGLTVDDNNGLNSYVPDNETDFNTLLTYYIKPAAGDLAASIKEKIVNADQILKNDYSKYMKALTAWNQATDHSKPSKNPSAEEVIIQSLYDKMDKSDFKELISTVFPYDVKDTTFERSGDVTIAEYVQKDIEKIIPELFNREFANFKNKMQGIRGKKFADFLDSKFDSKVLDPSSIELNKWNNLIQYADISSTPKTITAKSGKDVIMDLSKLIYKTGLYKTVFAADPRLKEMFVKLYEKDTDNSDLWNKDVYNKSSQDIADMLNIVEKIISFQSVDKFKEALGTPNSPTHEKLFIAALQKLVTTSSDNLVSTEKNVEFSWAAGNSYMGSQLQKQVILSNIENVVDYLRNNDKAKILGDKLDSFIKTFTKTEQSASAIAQLGPKLQRYNMEKFILGFSSDVVETGNIIEQMVTVDPIKVLVPNTGHSQSFKALEKTGGAATLGLVAAAGVLIFIIGGALIGLSFTKRIVVGGKTWSVKMIILRVALLIIALAGIYMVLTGTVLSGHEALTTIVNV